MQLDNGMYVVRNVPKDMIEDWVIVNYGNAYAYDVRWYGDLADYERIPRWEADLYQYGSERELLDAMYENACFRDNLVLEYIDEWDAAVPEHGSGFGENDEVIAFVLQHTQR